MSCFDGLAPDRDSIAASKLAEAAVMVGLASWREDAFQPGAELRAWLSRVGVSTLDELMGDEAEDLAAMIHQRV